MNFLYKPQNYTSVSSYLIVNDTGGTTKAQTHMIFDQALRFLY